MAQTDPSCSYTVVPTSQTFNYPAEDQIITVTTTGRCEWTVDNQNDWVQIHFFTNFVGSAVVRYTVFDNIVPFPRSGIITVAGQIFTIYQQPAPCSYSILPANDLVGRMGGSGQVTVFTMAGCSWASINTNRWITITAGTNGAGNGVVNYLAAPNYSSLDRTGNVTIAGQRFALSQFGTSCTYTLSSTNQSYLYGGGSGSISVSRASTCLWDVVNTNSWIILTSGTNNVPTQPVTYVVQPNPIAIARSGVLTIAGKNATISQAAAPCIFALSAPSAFHTAVPEIGAFGLTVPFGCNWVVQNTNSWISLISGGSGNGTGTIVYQVLANVGTTARSGSLVAGGLTFTVNQAAPTLPSLTSSPAGQSVVSGATVAFSAAANGTPPLSYQWRLNGANLTDNASVSGSQTPNLRLANVQNYQSGSYSVLVSNFRGSVASAPAVLLVNTRPGLAPIANKTVGIGAPLVFRVFGSDTDLPAQVLTYSFASPPPVGASLDSASGMFTWISAQTLGQNVISIRVADNGSPSLDAIQTFTINVINAVVSNPTLISTGSVWKYRDTGANLGTAWTSPSYSDSAWASGPAKLGYGNGNDATVVSYGSSSSLKYITTYFRRTFTVENPSVFNALNLRVLRDDGVVVYLNGIEVFRNNMPAGLIAYNTLAASSIASTDRTNFFAGPPLYPGYLVPGQNVLSAEVHQASASSTAMAFDLELRASQNVTVPVAVTQPQSLTLTEGAATSFTFTVSGLAPLFHQWYFNGQILPNATNATLVLQSVRPSQAGSYVDVVTNGFGSLSSDAAVLAVIPIGANTAPHLAYIADRSALRGTLVNFTAVATDSDVPAQRLTYSLDPGAPSGATIDPVTGAFAWTAAASQTPTPVQIPIRVTDNGSPPSSATKTVTITVVDGTTTTLTFAGTGSVWKYRDTGEDLGTAWTGRSFNDAAWNSGPSMLGYGLGGEATVVSYGGNASAKYITTYFRRAFVVTDPSSVSPLNLQVRRDDGVVVYLNGTEVYRDNMPTGPVNYLTIAPLSVAGTDKTSFHVSPPVNPAVLVAGTNIIAAEVHQHAGSSTSMDFDLQLTSTGTKPGNLAPVLGEIVDRTVLRGNPVTFTVPVTDADLPAQTLTFSLGPGAPSGASINPTTGVFTWTPSASQGPGTFAVTIRATDNGSPPLSDAATVALTVTIPVTNKPPVLAAIPDKSAVRGQLLTFTASATDPDVPAQILTFSLDPGAPSGASINPATGMFTWTPSVSQGPGMFSVTIRATDNGSPPLSDADTVAVTVTLPITNNPPVLADIPDKIAVRDRLLTFAASATDSDVPAQLLSYGLDPGAPDGASINPTNGVFTWTPSAADPIGSTLVTIRVTDNGSPVESSSKSFSITLIELREIGLMVGSTNGLPGTDVLVPVQVNRFTNVASLQFSLHWDPQTASYMGIEEQGLLGLNFGTAQTNTGTLGVSWDDVSGSSQTLEDRAMLFAVRFNITGATGQTSTVWVDGIPTPIEAANGDLEVMPVTALAGHIISGPPGTNDAALPLTDTSSPGALTISVDSGGAVTLQWTASRGRTYRLQYTSDIATDLWTDLGDDLIAAGATASATDAPGAVRQRFYRVLRLD